MTGVGVCCVSLPERFALLGEALASVHKQTWEPESILVGIDPRVVGEAENMNRLVRASSSEFVAFLHDDDLWTPDHLFAAMRCAEETGADVVVSNVTLDGRPASSIEPHHCDYSDLLTTNWFPPSAVVARRSLVLDVGGFTQEPDGVWVDWTMWKRLYNAGAKFACTHRDTFIYRFGAWGNGSYH
jgi:glycosyltransferase involved in cell wall biosynthesis